MKTVRCAIYTRKSSDEGLEQAFNSLDAQRESCAAYILSQASEGWTALPEIYDDGGLSGGTLDRPALQRLLAEVAAGRVDIIVVYKVDRLTRSLLDFSKLVEAFDKAGTSFVSVTQSFNTTTSMGRLTLNMLLSFAQFEREVTAERIRDKIAASKAKGMWMGGIAPIGYRPDGRTLAIVDEHAAFVRHVFARYLDTGTVRQLADDLARSGHRAPARTTVGGKPIGGAPLSRGQLYQMLKSRTYLGEIEHKGAVYPGLHDPIIARDLWDRAQAMLIANLQGKRSGTYARNPSLLAGKIFSATGEPLIASHASKGHARYRYYISAGDQTGTATRIPAREIETAVVERVARLFDDPLTLMASAWADVPADRYGDVTRHAAHLATRLRQREHALVSSVIVGVSIQDGQIAIDCATLAVAEALGVPTAVDAPSTITVHHNVRLTRTGLSMRLIHDSGVANDIEPNAALLRLLIQARIWWAELRKGELDVTALACREGTTSSYVSRVVRLAFLAPDLVQAILVGKQPVGISVHALKREAIIAPDWREQRRGFGMQGAN